MPRLLKDLTINEVSSVDAGAGEGVKVMLMKRHTPADIDDSNSLVIDIASLRKAAKERDMPIDLKDPAIKKALDEIIKAALDPVIAKKDDEIALLKLSDVEKQFCVDQKMDDAAKLAFAKMTDAERKKKMEDEKEEAAKRSGDNDVTKSLRAELAKSHETIGDLTKRLGALEADRVVADFAKRATDAGLTAADGEIMRKAYGGDAEAQKSLDAKIKALTTQANKSGLFNELGGGGNDNAGGKDAYAQLMGKADELRKTDAGKALTPAQAFTKVYEDPSNFELVKQYRSEEIAKRARVAA